MLRENTRALKQLIERRVEKYVKRPFHILPSHFTQIRQIYDTHNRSFRLNYPIRQYDDTLYFLLSSQYKLNIFALVSIKVIRQQPQNLQNEQRLRF